MSGPRRIFVQVTAVMDFQVEIEPQDPASRHDDQELANRLVEATKEWLQAELERGEVEDIAVQAEVHMQSIPTPDTKELPHS